METNSDQALVIESIVCPHCSMQLELDADLCSECQQSTIAVDEESVLESAKQRDEAMLHSKSFVLISLFCVTGALGLPALWKSSAFSQVGKIILSVFVVIYTAAMLWLTGLVLKWGYQEMVVPLL